MGCNCGGRSSSSRPSGSDPFHTFRITHPNGATSHYPSDTEAEKNYKGYRASPREKDRDVTLERMKLVGGELVVDPTYTPPAD